MCGEAGQGAPLAAFLGPQITVSQPAPAVLATPSPHCKVAGAVGTRTMERDGQRAQGLAASGPPRQASPHQRGSLQRNLNKS